MMFERYYAIKRAFGDKFCPCFFSWQKTVKDACLPYETEIYIHRISEIVHETCVPRKRCIDHEILYNKMVSREMNKDDFLDHYQNRH